MTKQDELLRKAVKNFNAKIKRLEKKAQLSAEYIPIPQKVYVSKIKSSGANIESIISELKAFTARPKVTVDSELKKMVKGAIADDCRNNKIYIIFRINRINF